LPLFRRRDVPDGLEQAAVVEPIDPFEGGMVILPVLARRDRKNLRDHFQLHDWGEPADAQVGALTILGPVPFTGDLLPLCALQQRRVWRTCTAASRGHRPSAKGRVRVSEAAAPHGRHQRQIDLMQ
jgi:hypothetical protein